jgi:hypothetical protein
MFPACHYSGKTCEGICYLPNAETATCCQLCNLSGRCWMECETSKNIDAEEKKQEIEIEVTWK